eukprot:TRINITY_DN3769_c0_g5_i1.p1 TRINITY_DN3769_c0_g5~~TRINITY_DN3769_c0_g5_i1.p1  ORF type:complete len:355 (+),score=40.34 TRINITY_DN3769_c0_g5_i1:146-1210(+)
MVVNRDHTALFYAIQCHLHYSEGHIHRRWLKIIEMLLKDAPLEIVISNRVSGFHQCDHLVNGSPETFPRSYEIFQLITDHFPKVPVKQFFTIKWQAPSDIQGLMLDNQYKAERSVFLQLYNPAKPGFITVHRPINRYFPRFINFLIDMMRCSDFDEIKRYINALPKPVWTYTGHGMFDAVIDNGILRNRGNVLEYIFKNAPLSIRTRKSVNEDDTYLHKAAKSRKLDAINALSKGPLIVRTTLSSTSGKRVTPAELYPQSCLGIEPLTMAHFYTFRNLVKGFQLDKIHQILSKDWAGYHLEQNTILGQKDSTITWCMKRRIKIAWIQDQLDEPIYNHEGAAKNAALWMYTSSWI